MGSEMCIRDSYFFTGNHDLWMKSYFQDEYDIPVYRNPITKTIHGKDLHLGHGDGLGPGDYKYKIMKKVFTNSACQAAFGLLPSSVGFGAMKFFSKRSREKYKEPVQFLGDKKESLIVYARDYLSNHNIDFFLFGHRHLPIDYTLEGKKSRYINLGEWLSFRSFAVMDNGDLQLKFWKNSNGKIFG